ncbi:MAG: hypothetical protein ACI9KF_001036 [Arenicella sp.]|jgi:hypothetical protein
MFEKLLDCLILILFENKSKSYLPVEHFGIKIDFYK